MRVTIVVIIVVCTALLITAGMMWPGQYSSPMGVVSGTAMPGLSTPMGTPEQAASSFWKNVQRKDWAAAHEQLVNADKIDQSAFARDVGGESGSLRTLSALQTWEV